MESKEHYSILIVDDDPNVVRILKNILSDFAPLRFATSGKDALAIARKTPPDLVLLDVEMPDLSGFEVCSQFKADKALAMVPIIFVTSHEGVELHTAGLQLGAADFITKPPHPALVVARVRAQQGTKRFSDTLRSAITMDFLTGTSNRVHFEKALQQELLRARRSQTPLCLMFLEIDKFIDYEAESSEDTAAIALRAVADTLRTVVHRPADLLARYAAGTFAALLPETDLRGATTVAERAQREIDLLNLSVATFSGSTRLSVFVGVGCSTELHGIGSSDSASKEALVAAAERAVGVARKADRHEAEIR